MHIVDVIFQCATSDCNAEMDESLLESLIDVSGGTSWTSRVEFFTV